MTGSNIAPAPDNEIVIFATPVTPTGEGLHPHGPADKLTKSVGELRESYRTVVSQILAMTADTPDDSALRLTTIEVGLGFSAEGELGFIAKATVGVEATVTLTFERK